MKKAALILFIAMVVIYIACEPPHSNANSPMKNPEANVNCSHHLDVLSSLSRPRINDGDLDETEFLYEWRRITEADTSLLSFLISLHADTNSRVVCNGKSHQLGFGDPNSSYWQNISGVSANNNRIAALHFICALYEDDYYFSSNRELYFSSEIDKYLNDPKEIGVFNNPRVLDSAWRHVEQWHTTCQAKDWREIRQSCPPPLAGTGILWVGQPGCLLYKNYPSNNQDRLLHRLRP